MIELIIGRFRDWDEEVMRNVVKRFIKVEKDGEEIFYEDFSEYSNNQGYWKLYYIIGRKNSLRSRDYVKILSILMKFLLYSQKKEELSNVIRLIVDDYINQNL